jgi:hypothetical protein
MIEIGRVDGGRFGSHLINEAFENQFLASRLGGAEVVADLIARCPGAFLGLRGQLESAKIHFKPESQSDIYLLLPAAIHRRLGAAGRKRLSRAQGGTDDAILVTPDDFRTLFDPVVNAILTKIAVQWDEMGRTRVGGRRDAILLVGGFSASPYLQEAVRARFGAQAQILIAPDPAAAVLLGALHFCYAPHTRARRSRFTYGVRCSRDFEMGLDPQDKKFETSDGLVKCNDHFAVFVRAGQTVGLKEEVSSLFFPLEPTQRKVKIDLYASAGPNPRYVTDPGCDSVGTLTIDVSSAMRFALNDRAIRVHMRFGETQLRASATLEHTGQSVSTSLRFHSNY